MFQEWNQRWVLRVGITTIAQCFGSAPEISTTTLMFLNAEYSSCCLQYKTFTLRSKPLPYTRLSWLHELNRLANMHFIGIYFRNFEKSCALWTSIAFKKSMRFSCYPTNFCQLFWLMFFWMSSFFYSFCIYCNSCLSLCPCLIIKSTWLKIIYMRLSTRRVFQQENWTHI